MTLRPKARTLAVRNQTPTGFARILEDLIRLAPEILGAALVDQNGETVDFAGVLDPFVVQIAAAELRLVLGLANGPPLARLGKTARIVVRAAEQTFVVHTLREGYALALVAHRRAFDVSWRALSVAAELVSLEAGWTPVAVVAAEGDRWRAVDVKTAPSDRSRPLGVRLGETWQPLEVMGTIVGLAPREHGFRVRLRSGAEISLIREPLGRWYSDDLPDGVGVTDRLGGKLSTGAG